MKINKSKYKLTTKGSIIFFLIFFTGDILFSMSFAYHHVTYAMIGLTLMIMAFVLIFYVCYKNLGLYGMSEKRELKV